MSVFPKETWTPNRSCCLAQGDFEGTREEDGWPLAEGETFSAVMFRAEEDSVPGFVISRLAHPASSPYWRLQATVEAQPWYWRLYSNNQYGGQVDPVIGTWCRLAVGLDGTDIVATLSTLSDGEWADVIVYRYDREGFELSAGDVPTGLLHVAKYVGGD